MRLGWWLATATFVALTMMGRPVLADDAEGQDSSQNGDEERAREAWQRGKDAFSRGDFAGAAEQMLLADELRPGDKVLQFALDAAERADDPVLGMQAVQRAEERQLHRETSERLRAKFIGRVGQLMLRCPEAAPCRALVDRRPVSVDRPFWIATGDHVAEISSQGEEPVLFAARVRAGEITVVPEPQAAPAAPPAQEPVVDPQSKGLTATVPPSSGSPPEDDDSGLSPAWFFVGAGATAVLGGVTIWSGVDTLAKHDDFDAAPSQELQAAGQDAQLRTNVLIGATVGTAVISALLLAFADWGGDGATQEAARKMRRGAGTDRMRRQRRPTLEGIPWSPTLRF